MTPKVSVITASYNYENYIKETIESVINQTYTDWELIIVDDGSTDNSIEVIKKYCNKNNKIKLYTHKNNENKGLAETIKLGLSKASGDWIAFLESDDTWTENCLEEKVKVIDKNKDVKFIFSDVNMVGDKEEIEDFKEYYFILQKKFKNESQNLDLSKQFFIRNWIYTFSVVMLRKNILEQCDFNSPIKKLLDYYLWAQVANRTKMFYLNKKLTNWRMHKTSYIHALDNVTEQKQFIEKIAEICHKTFQYKIQKTIKNIIRIKTGKNAYLKIFGKDIFPMKKIF
jgi:glycosyltransferase involved in cell wall biosynthesis